MSTASALTSIDFDTATNFLVKEEDEPTIDAFYDSSTFNLILDWAFNNAYSDVIFTSEQTILYRKNRQTYASRQRSLSEAQVADTARWVASEGAAVRALTGEFCDASYATPKCPITGERKRFRTNITRVHSSRCENAVAIVMRTIAGEPWDLAVHKLPKGLQRYCFADSGLNMVVGPMGSGKTTLVTSMIKHINLTTRNYIVTYEDPIEFDFSMITRAAIPVAQTEIHTGIKSFSEALANVTRRSADVIYWGESRDIDSIRSLTVACDLGAAVYTTAHANSVASTIPRLVRMFPAHQRDGMQAALVCALQTLCFQCLLPCTKGGVVALREYLFLDDEVKRKLVDLPLSQLSSEIQNIQLAQGGDLNTALMGLSDNNTITDLVLKQQVEKHTKGH